MKKNTMPVVYLIVALVLIGMSVGFLQNEKKHLLEASQEAFLKAVNQDLNNRIAIWGGYVAVSKPNKKNNNITIEKEDGKEKYSLDSINYDQNVDAEIQRRMLHSAAIVTGRFPHPDTLNALWQKELHALNINTKTHLKIEILTKDSHKITQSLDSLSGRPSDNLPLFYVGAKNELALHPYIHLSLYDMVNHNYRLYILFGGLSCWIIMPFILLRFRKKTEHIEIKNSDTSEEQEKSTPQEIPSDILSETEETYHLSENVIYAPLLRCIYSTAGTVKLSKHKNSLLEQLVKAEEHRMHGVDLAVAVWKEDSINLDKLYTLNSRLRIDLRKLGEGFALESMEDGYFQLITPLFTKNERY